MAGPTATPCLPPPEAPVGVHPGGIGFFVRCEIAWGRLRRWYLRRFRPAHVARWLALRQGEDPAYADVVIDPRDLKFIRNVCGLWFRPDDDVYARREHLGFARWGYAELVGFTTIFVLLGGLFAALMSFHWLVAVPFLASWLLIAEVVWFFRD